MNEFNINNKINNNNNNNIINDKTNNLNNKFKINLDDDDDDLNLDDDDNLVKSNFINNNNLNISSNKLLDNNLNNNIPLNYYQKDPNNPNATLHLAELDEKYDIFNNNNDIVKDDNYIPYYLLTKDNYIKNYLTNGKNKKEYIYIDWKDYNTLSCFDKNDKKLFDQIDHDNYNLNSDNNIDKSRFYDTEYNLNPDYIPEYCIIKNFKPLFEKIVGFRIDKNKNYKRHKVRIKKLNFNTLNPDTDIDYFIKLKDVKEGTPEFKDKIYYLNKRKKFEINNDLNNSINDINDLSEDNELKGNNKSNNKSSNINSNNQSQNNNIEDLDLDDNLNNINNTNNNKKNKNKKNKNKSSNKNKKNSIDSDNTNSDNDNKKKKGKKKSKPKKKNKTKSVNKNKKKKKLIKSNNLDSDSNDDINLDNNSNTINNDKSNKSNSPKSNINKKDDFDFAFIPLGVLLDNSYNNDSHRINCYHMYNIYVSRLLDNIIYKTGWEDVYKFKGEFRQELPCFCYGCGDLVKPSGLRQHIIKYHNKDIPSLESNMRININNKNKSNNIINKNYYSNMNKYKTIKLTLNKTIRLNSKKFNINVNYSNTDSKNSFCDNIVPIDNKYIGNEPYNSNLVNDNIYFLLLYKLHNYNTEYKDFWYLASVLNDTYCYKKELFKSNFINNCKIKTIDESLSIIDDILKTLSDKPTSSRLLNKIKEIYEDLKECIILHSQSQIKKFKKLY